MLEVDEILGSHTVMDDKDTFAVSSQSYDFVVSEQMTGSHQGPKDSARAALLKLEKLLWWSYMKPGRNCRSHVLDDE